MNLSLSEQLAYSTIRIECQYKDGSFGTGTGFFFKLLEKKETGEHIPVIITNKHVINNAVSGRLLFTKVNNNEPNDQEHWNCTLHNFESLWKKHPDSTVDLCALPIAPILNIAKNDKEDIFYIPLDMSLLPTENQLNQISSLEEILMVGYPNGIWDSINNKPIFRRGVTATSPILDYNGKKEFMIDAACFPGSSGSPVFIFNAGSYIDKKGNTYLGQSRLILMGVLYGGPQHTATGEVRIVTVPTSQKALSISTIPNNLGLVIKWNRIAELEKLFK